MNVFVYFLPLIALASASGWGYSDDHGPSTWKTDYPACEASSQSPINIVKKDTEYDSKLTAFTFTGYEVPPTGADYTLKNNGHAVVNELSATSSDAYSVSGGGLPTTYYAAQFHFHWGSKKKQGSEHTVNKKAYPMEMHIVHYSSQYASLSEAADKEQGLAVLGFFFKIGKHNAAFDEIVNHLLSITHKDEEVTLEPFGISSLLPSDMTSYWRYNGSLTTPPCYESVIWTVFKTPIIISKEQLAEFRTLSFDADPPVHMEDNFRPPQPLNGRTVLSSNTA